MYKQKYKEGQQIHKDIYLYICRYVKKTSVRTVLQRDC